MAELLHEGATAVIGFFLEAFNERHGTAFSLSASEPTDDPSCDYICLDERRPGDPLKVQLTCATATVESSAPNAPAGSEPAVHQMHEWLHNEQACECPSVIFETPAMGATRAVKAKADRLGLSATDLVLVILFDFGRFDERVDLPEMVDGVARLEVPPALVRKSRFAEDN